MRFLVLGPVEAAAAARPVELGRGRRRTILAVLLAAGGRPVTTGALIEAVWGADPPATARKSLQSHVSRLRGDLDDAEAGAAEAVVTEPDGYRFDRRRHELDADRFASLLGRARDVVDGEPAAAVALFDTALELWRGRAFGELADRPAIHAEAVRLERARRSAAAERVDALLALGRHTQVVGELEATVREEPFDERPVTQLMLALYRSGRQADALAAYRSLRERLQDELGVDPSPRVAALEERILRHDAALLPPGAPDPATGRPVRAADHPGARTPVTARALVGRDDDIAALVEEVAPGRLVTLTGPGGVGKTTLAEQVAERLAPRFPDGVVQAALAGVRDADRVDDALVTVLGIQPQGDTSSLETLGGALADRQLLLVLDNCEHVLATVASAVDAILRRCPNVAVLASSRERLHLPDERLWAVQPLAVPAPEASAAEVAATPAGELFVLRADAAAPDFELTDADAPAVAELCRRLDGMPLAIELAAARVRAISPEDLVARLDQRFALLAGGPRHEGGRHRTLGAVVAWSYDLLTEEEATLFDRLSVFAGSFSLGSVEDVCAGGSLASVDVAGLMGELVDKSMVVAERTGTGARYRFLDTLREYAARRLRESDDPQVWRRAHLEHHVRLAERHGPEVRGREEPRAVPALHGSFDDLRAAHAWAVEIGDLDGALRIPAALGDYLFYRLRDEVTTWARRSLALAGADQHPAAAAALTTAAFGATSRAECDRAVREAEEALRLAAPDSLPSLWAHVALGTAALYEGHLREMLGVADTIAASARRLEEPFYEAFAGVLRVIGHAYLDEHGPALAALAELERAATASGSPTMRAFARYCRGEALLETAPAEAADALDEAVELARTVDNALVHGVSMVSLASLRGRLGDTREALEHFRDTVAHWRRLGDHTHQLTTLRNLVVLLADVGADEPAALLHGAVAEGLTPSFGLEERRLTGAWERVVGRLGQPAADAAAGRGRELTPTQVSAAALRHLDELLAR